MKQQEGGIMNKYTDIFLYFIRQTNTRLTFAKHIKMLQKKKNSFKKRKLNLIIFVKQLRL